MGTLAGSPMTRDEALKILNIEEVELKDEDGYSKSNVDPKEIMERFDSLIEKNQVSKGGSFYIQSKIFWAKQHLMQDFPVELNVSQWNPEGQGKKAMDKEADEEQTEDKSEEKQEESKEDAKEENTQEKK